MSSKQSFAMLNLSSRYFKQKMLIGENVKNAPGLNLIKYFPFDVVPFFYIYIIMYIFLN